VMLPLVPVRCLVFPDAFPLPDWLAACAVMDAENAHADVGKIAVPGLVRREQVTYPDLRGVARLGWAYLGWRGRLYARQASAGTGLLKRHEVARMHPTLAAAMVVSARYHWVYALPELVPDWPLPPGAGWGLLPAGAGPTTLPEWLPGETQPI
jgi:hypothetical protein